MSRPIEFRGKDIDGNWLYGSLITLPSGACKILVDLKMVNVDYETVGQFTGLHDKNGKKVFEGDVVLLHDGLDEPLKCSVRWSEEHCRFACSSIDSGAGEWLRSMNLDYEVIGSIHDKGEQ